MVQCDPHPIFTVRKGHNEGLKAFKLAVSTSRQVLQSVLYIFNLHIQVSYTCATYHHQSIILWSPI